MLPFLAATASAADCPSPLDAAAIEAHVGRAEQAYAALEPGAFVRALDALALELPCLGERVPPPLAARVHRIRALLLWGDGRELDARRALGALRRIAPEAALPADLVPAGHPIRAAFGDLEPPAFGTLPEPLSGVLVLDGVASIDRPTNQPTVAQLEADGRIRWTVLLQPTDAPPPYEARQVAVALPEASSPGGRPRTALLVVAGASLAGAGVAYTGAWMSNAGFQRFEASSAPSASDAFDALEGRRNLANTLTVGAATLSAVAVGAALAAVLP